MRKIAVVGDKSSVYGFSALGVDIQFAEDCIQAEKILHHLILNDYAIIYMVESLVTNLKEQIEKLQIENDVSIIPIPGVSKNTGVGFENLKFFVKRAVGSDMLMDDLD